MEKCLILVKPDGLQRGLAGEIIHRFERKGLKIIGLKMMKVEDALLEEHYAHIVDRPFYAEIRDNMKSAPILAMALAGPKGAITAIRLMVGTTQGYDAQPGTIRGDFGLVGSFNMVHASDSPENGEVEVRRFFKDSELFSYDRTIDRHIVSERTDHKMLDT